MAVCRSVLQKGVQCKRKIAEGQRFCWQHANGLTARWHSLTRNQSVLFVLAVGGLVGTIGFGIYSIFHAANASDRAYVSFAGFGNEIVNSSPNGKVWGYLYPLLWTNTGTTNAQGKIAMGHLVSTSDLPSDFSFPLDKPPTSFNVAPKRLVAWNYDFHLDELQALQQHTSRYFIWGTLTYHDLPRSPLRVHEFCVEIVHVMTPYGATDLSNPASNPVLNYDNCTRHNCDDEICSDYSIIAKEM